MPSVSFGSLVDHPLRQKMLGVYRCDEEKAVLDLIQFAKWDKAQLEKAQATAARLIEGVRDKSRGKSGVEAFLQTYQLTTEEGIALMCLAEALLRIPDAATRDKLIRDKIGPGDWKAFAGKSGSFFINASSWGLVLTGGIVNMGQGQVTLLNALGHAVARLGEPVIRAAVAQAMRIMGQQFVMGETIDAALARAEDSAHRDYRYSYDMLGEAAKTAADAKRYFDTYMDAVGKIGAKAANKGPIEGAGISVKLSAWHPRYELFQRDRAIPELSARLLELAQQAKKYNINLCIDAEESERLDISLAIIEKVFGDPSLAGWDGFGLALQAYQKRAFPAVDYLAELAKTHKRRLMLRLVKGAYWDSEVKRAQVNGLSGYAVYTRKVSTDLSYLACARKILGHSDTVFYPQFGTHNALTAASIMELAGSRDFEFQRLHGMGEELYGQIIKPPYGKPCRVYAPVGTHEDLLAYLVRRLLENGANSSFVHRIADSRVPVAELLKDPVGMAEGLNQKKHPRIPLPKDIYGMERPNSKSFDLSNPATLDTLQAELKSFAARKYQSGPIVGGNMLSPGRAIPVTNPANKDIIVGEVHEAEDNEIRAALTAAKKYAFEWNQMPVESRAACLDKAADLLEQNMVELMALAINEAGKTLGDAISEVREAVDFCRYYAAQARKDFKPMALPGPTGESNKLYLSGRGVFLCISPWNFPLAIFLGQVTAALAAGNCVIAKPAEQTPLIAARAVQLLHQAGIPFDALHLLPGRGETVGAKIVSSPEIAGVAFTGGTGTARAINRALAAREGSIVPFIAETGGQNAMIVDSSALPEQVVQDVLSSAFQSAGQRCSALRVLYVQEEIAEKIEKMLIGALAEQRVGDPADLRTDIGPVIDGIALRTLQTHVDSMRAKGKIIYEHKLSPDCAKGSFISPTIVRIDSIRELAQEHFGPILHIIRFKSAEIDKVIMEINGTGFGLTFGLHSRIQESVDEIIQRLRAGNIYINRNIIGAVVGVQPFGGQGLSGTGPKAGGPHYLHRFATEKTVTIDTTAAGGNASLLSMGEESVA